MATLRRVMSLIKARATVDADRPGDEGVDLRSLLPAYAAGEQQGATT